MIPTTTRSSKAFRSRSPKSPTEHVSLQSEPQVASSKANVIVATLPTLIPRNPTHKIIRLPSCLTSVATSTMMLRLHLPLVSAVRVQSLVRPSSIIILLPQSLAFHLKVTGAASSLPPTET